MIEPLNKINAQEFTDWWNRYMYKIYVKKPLLKYDRQAENLIK